MLVSTFLHKFLDEVFIEIFYNIKISQQLALKLTDLNFNDMFFGSLFRIFFIKEITYKKMNLSTHLKIKILGRSTVNKHFLMIAY
jgi:hypothetical protein